MPIILTRNLPAYRILRDEGVEVLQPGDGTHRQPPPLRIALLNLMPEKTNTETQIARLLGESAHPVELTFFVPDSYRSKTTPAGHLATFYDRWSSIRERHFDGLIVTGAPVETLPFEDVTYWSELTAIFDWARCRVGQSYYICWAAQAALYHFHGVPKRPLAEKMFGVFAHRIVKPDTPLMKNLDEGFRVPVSRHTEVAAADLPAARGLEILAESDEAGLCLVHDAPIRAHYMFNHLEYDADTLAREYARDLRRGRPVALPRHYFPDDDPARDPAHSWRGSARTLFRNWLNEVERQGRSGECGAEAMDWLLGGDAGPVPVGIPLADFLISVETSLEAVPALLRVLAEIGHSPMALKVAKGNAPLSYITLRISEIEGAAAAWIARKILQGVAGVHRTSYRHIDGSGGTMVPEAGTAPHADIWPSHQSVA
jgi:homoserine O-succinyltransferase